MGKLESRGGFDGRAAVQLSEFEVSKPELHETEPSRDLIGCSQFSVLGKQTPGSRREL